MNWKKFKKQIEVEDCNPDTSLGVFEIKIGCTDGKTYIDFCDNNQRTGFRILELEDKQLSTFSKGLIMEWARDDKTLTVPKITENDKNLEKLIQKARSKISAIESLEV